MQPLNPLANLLHQLLTTGEVVRSKISARANKDLVTLFDLGALREERRGGGWVVMVANQESVRRFVDRKFPSGLFGENDTSEGRRTQSLNRFGDTKSMPGLDFEFVLLRVFGDAQVTTNISNSTIKIDAPEITRQTGCVALTLQDTGDITDLPLIHGNVATVEGPELFYRFDWASVDVSVAILTDGRMSERLVNWVASSMINGHLTHFGDYDPVGLDEYRRLKEQASRASFFLPVNLESYFKENRFLKPALMDKSSALLPRLAETKDLSILTVIDLMQRYGGGVEQEVLLLDNLRLAEM
ncbi:hypothetical protein SCT_2745 [Sulfuricella sp. T08]|uniref:hypothetical protein n=1 Tax=Sulfuricella sp. T08 TaxID=1632857 RepID=UPI0006179F07|nr:hypothetical protein [Sulfuricella sp. T08]GAO37324.1 hypothetical protein SCT_2745 [Sulfuricella sp. T08]